MFLKRTFAILVVICIIMACIPMSAFAFVDSAAAAISGMASAINAYGAANNVSLFYNFWDTTNTSDNIKSISDITSSLWNTYTSVNSSTYDDYERAAIEWYRDPFIKVPDINGTYKVAIKIKENLMPFVDDFWNAILSGPAEMVRVDNMYYTWNDSSGNVIIHKIYSEYPFVSVIPLNFDNNTPSSTIYSSSMPDDGTFLIRYTYPSVDSTTYLYYKGGIKGNPLNYPNALFLVMVCGVTGNNNKELYVFTNGSGTSTVPYYTKYFENSGSYTSDTVNNWSSDARYPGVYYRKLDYTTVNRVEYSDRYYHATLDDGLVVAKDFFNGVYDSYNTSEVKPYIGDSAPQNVYIPDNDDVNYSPIPQVIVTDVTWDDAIFGDGQTLTEQQKQSITQSLADEISTYGALELADTTVAPVDPDASEVYIPFLPVSLPNFNFSLSGIWHYVREWISSLGAWFTMVLTVWSNLPYAMVVPVYATMVILIVLGVYKRFFM